ncbi:hypothetical protein EST38_g10092 [Candolleomyces aberdarensis]|uniref:Uncharacterized protein n=1 Tax=Candolleomyces aberdarensis TaxID=2316362 RepID=A0A4V1Q2P0_9AGAR|nr:hypothetical protein EST38_g10092 [Candolleomyces aberdarensis]
MTDHLSVFPTELIRAILVEVVESDNRLLVPSRQAQAQDLLSVTHVNSRFRDVALADASLWNRVLYLNNIHPAFLHAILHRSSPLPLSLAFTEDNTLTRGQGLQWVFGQFSRVEYLHIDVAEEVEGALTKLFLTMAAPLLRQCVVRFHGERNVCLNENISLFHNNAPVLNSLDLLNCYILPQNQSSSDLSIFSVRYLGAEPIEAGHPFPFTSIRNCVEWQGYLRFTTGIILSNCIVPVDTAEAALLMEVELPSLESLMIAASPSVCEQLARILRYPAQCSVSVNVLLPRGRPVFSQDSEASAIAGCLFILPHEVFKQCWLVTRRESSSVRFLSTTGRLVALRFELAHVLPGLSKPIDLCMQATNFILSSIGPLTGSLSLSPRGVLFHALWSTLASILSAALAGVSRLHLAFHHRDPLVMIGLSSFLSNMVLVQSVVFSTPNVWGDLKFLHIVFRRKIFFRLRTIVIRLQGDLPRDAKFGLSIFLKYRQCCGNSIKKVEFGLSTSFIRELGFARSDGIRAMLGDIAADFPRDVDIQFERKS